MSRDRSNVKPLRREAKRRDRSYQRRDPLANRLAVCVLDDDGESIFEGTEQPPKRYEVRRQRALRRESVERGLVIGTHSSSLPPNRAREQRPRTRRTKRTGSSRGDPDELADQRPSGLRRNGVWNKRPGAS